MTEDKFKLAKEITDEIAELRKNAEDFKTASYIVVCQEHEAPEDGFSLELSPKEMDMIYEKVFFEKILKLQADFKEL